MESIDNFFFQASTVSPSNSHDFDVSCFFASSDSNHNGLQSEPSPSINSSEYSSFQKQLPFTIIRGNEQPSKQRSSVVQKKVIEKKNKGGKRKLPNQQELKSLLSQAKKHYIPEGIENTNLSDSARRKMIQAVKNRIAAQRTRDRRKAQFSELQETQEQLEKTNVELNTKYSELERKFKLLEEANKKLAAENEELRRRTVVNPNPNPIPVFPTASREIVLENNNFMIDEEIEFDSLLRQKNGNLSLSRTSSTKSDWMQLFTSFAIIIAVYSGSHIKVGNVVHVENGKDGKPETPQYAPGGHAPPEGSGPGNPESGEPDTFETEFTFGKSRSKHGDINGGGNQGEESVKKSKGMPKNDGGDSTFTTFSQPTDETIGTTSTGPADETIDATKTGPADETDDPNSFLPASTGPAEDPVDSDSTGPTNESDGYSKERGSSPNPQPLADSNSGELDHTQSLPGSQSPENFNWNFDYVCIGIFLFSILCLIGFKYMKRVWNWFENRSSPVQIEKAS